MLRFSFDVSNSPKEGEQTDCNRCAEHLREYIEDLREELQWDTTFQKTHSQLIAATRRAKQEIAAGQAKPLDYG